MDRHPDKDFGYYLHLHGSPLFLDDGPARIKKLKKKELAHGRVETSNLVRNHIVLTHIAHKPTVIDASRLLRSYWNRLAKAINESAEIILIGYSGEDEHLTKRSRVTGPRNE